jgi:hypothetical protein
MIRGLAKIKLSSGQVRIIAFNFDGSKNKIKISLYVKTSTQYLKVSPDKAALKVQN